MRKLHLIIVVFLIIGISYIAISPLLVVNQIKVGIEEKNSELLSKNIDFPILRENIKEQLNAAMMAKVTSEMENNPFGVLAAGLASKMADGIIDSFITPSGLSSLMQGKEPSKSPVETPSSSSLNNEEELFQDARYSYDSINRFSVWVLNENDEEIGFILRRNGVEWKLVNIIIPADKEALK